MRQPMRTRPPAAGCATVPAARRSTLLTRASIELMLQNHIGDAKAFGLRYGLGVGVATDDAPGESPLPIGGFGWYGIYSTWFWALPRRRTAVLFFANVLDPTMNLPLFARVVAAIDRA